MVYRRCYNYAIFHTHLQIAAANNIRMDILVCVLEGGGALFANISPPPSPGKPSTLHAAMSPFHSSHPTQEWDKRGTFHAANERTVQSFPLATDESVYAKYIKVEMQSHYGTEHFCPLSLVRVLGASMMEVYEYTEGQKEQQHSTSVVLPASEGGDGECLLIIRCVKLCASLVPQACPLQIFEKKLQRRSLVYEATVHNVRVSYRLCTGGGEGRGLWGW